MDNGFSERLKKARTNKGLSQSKLAQAVGVHHTHVGRYEKGQSRPSADILFKLADVLAVSPSFLLEGSADEIAQERLSDKDLLKQFQLAEKLPDADKQTIKRVIGSFLRNHQIDQALANSA